MYFAENFAQKLAMNVLYLCNLHLKKINKNAQKLAMNVLYLCNLCAK